MKTQFIEGTLAEAWTACPWAVRAIKVSGGHMCFESQAAYETWKNQK